MGNKHSRGKKTSAAPAPAPAAAAAPQKKATGNAVRAAAAKPVAAKPVAAKKPVSVVQELALQDVTAPPPPPPAPVKAVPAAPTMGAVDREWRAAQAALAEAPRMEGTAIVVSRGGNRQSIDDIRAQLMGRQGDKPLLKLELIMLVVILSSPDVSEALRNMELLPALEAMQDRMQHHTVASIRTELRTRMYHTSWMEDDSSEEEEDDDDMDEGDEGDEEQRIVIEELPPEEEPKPEPTPTTPIVEDIPTEEPPPPAAAAAETRHQPRRRRRRRRRRGGAAAAEGKNVGRAAPS